MSHGQLWPARARASPVIAKPGHVLGPTRAGSGQPKDWSIARSSQAQPKASRLAWVNQAGQVNAKPVRVRTREKPEPGQVRYDQDSDPAQTVQPGIGQLGPGIAQSQSSQDQGPTELVRSEVQPG